ncbi:aspartate/glutamate racemase family protein [Reyranella soli]|uniref:aspartate/glutamate racemase family protein n=1 Tax=Reyranella soli TaxID=1230389 RepID=UPI0011BE4E37|nr:aspartate/glutamate racemase family protein [Reyranella soli]
MQDPQRGRPCCRLELLQSGPSLLPGRPYREVIARLVARGAEAVVLGCTEIKLLVKPQDSTAPLVDTTTIDAEPAVDQAIARS